MNGLPKVQLKCYYDAAPTKMYFMYCLYKDIAATRLFLNKVTPSGIESVLGHTFL
jgi:hypothetical protein